MSKSTDKDKQAALEIALANIEKDYGNLAHGYVVTSHAAQGLTVDRVFIAQGKDSFPASSREQWYVSLSRGREAAKIYTDNKAELMENVRDSSSRLSATELMEARMAEQAETMKNYQFYADMRNRNYQLRQSQSQRLTR